MLANFISELANELSVIDTSWILHVDGLANAQGNGAGIIIKTSDETMID